MGTDTVTRTVPSGPLWQVQDIRRRVTVWGPKVALELPGRGPVARLAWHAVTVAPIEAGRSDAAGRGGQLSVGACILYTCLRHWTAAWVGASQLRITR